MNICNNIFYDAPFGAAVYSIISKDAEEKTLLDGNTYFTSGDGFIAKWNNMTYNDFGNFADIDKNGKYDKVDICKILKDWEESYK